MDEDDYDWDDHNPCEDCGLADYCDGWEYCREHMNEVENVSFKRV